MILSLFYNQLIEDLGILYHFNSQIQLDSRKFISQKWIINVAMFFSHYHIHLIKLQIRDETKYFFVINFNVNVAVILCFIIFIIHHNTANVLILF